MKTTTRSSGVLTLVTIVAVAFTATSADAGLIGHWKYDEGMGSTTADDSPNGNTATQAGTLGSWITGKAGNAYQLGGNASRFELVDSSDLQVTTAVTVSAWVNPTAASVFGLIAGIDQTGGIANDMYTLKTDGSDRPRWDIVAAAGMGTNVSLDAPDTLATYSSSTTDGWVHVVGVLDPGVSADLYVNGALVAQDTTDVPTEIQLAPTAFQMGHNASNNGNNPLNAAIDDIQVYDMALAADDVLFLFNNPGSAVASVPEPTTIVLTALGLVGILAMRRRRR